MSSWSSSSTGQKKGSEQQVQGRKGKGDQGGRRRDILRLCRKILKQKRDRGPFLSEGQRKERGANRRTEVDIWVRHKDGEMGVTPASVLRRQLEIDSCPKREGCRQGYRRGF